MLTDLLVKNASGDGKLYVEDVFSTWLYTGNGSTQTITNGIDLAGKGGMVWFKRRDAVGNNTLTDTINNGRLFTDTTGALNTNALVSSFNSDGFSLNTSSTPNQSAATYASWTFRKAPKFFDVVTYTGNGTAGRTISHSLGVAPGMIIIKSTNLTENWAVYHRSNGNTKYQFLNTTAASATSSNFWNNTDPTSTVFTLGNDASVNDTGSSYVAYLFAHDTTADGIVQCGSFTAGTGSVNLGWEPQWIMVKGISGSNVWVMFDTMRGWPVEAPNNLLQAQSSAAEGDTYVNIQPNATGFSYNFSPDCIYLAIRRGPMRVPTDATKVFSVLTRTGTGAAATISSGFPVDMIMGRKRTAPAYTGVVDRLRGFAPQLSTQQTVAEVSDTTAITAMGNTTVSVGDDSYNWGGFNQGSQSYAPLMFRRAPGFFDVVCYTGTGSARTVSHNLGVAPELMIVKSRSNTYSWYVYSSTTGNNAYLRLDATDAVLNSVGAGAWNLTTPTASNFSLGTFAAFNWSGFTYVAYLFATCAGVSKVGSYTGTGTTLQINCGFTNGARFVLIKRTDSTGGWHVWDSARGIIAGNDPYFLLNTSDAEVTNTDYVDAYSAGFELSSTAPAALNANGGTYIYLAIA